MHLYLGEPDKPLRALTRGRWEVTGIVGADARAVYYTSTERSPLERHLYAVDYKGRRKRLLTPAEGFHTIAPSAGMRYYISTFSSANDPGRVEICDAAGRTVRVVDDNAALRRLADSIRLPRKEFFTFTTPSENTFYLVIDKQRESENVYFLNAVTESDLLALAEKDKEPEDSNVSAVPDPEPVCACKDKCAPGEVNTDCPVCVLTMRDCTGKAPAVDPDTDPEPEKPEKGGSSTMILVVIAALAVGGAGYYLKIWKPKHDLDDAEDFDELTGGDEETVNEDDLDPTPRRVPRDEPEEPDYPEGYGYEEPEDDE